MNAVATLCHTVGGDALAPLQHDRRTGSTVGSAGNIDGSTISLGNVQSSVINRTGNNNSTMGVGVGGDKQGAVNHSHSSPTLPVLSRPRGNTSNMASSMLMRGLGGGNYSAWSPPPGAAGGPHGASPIPLSGDMVQHTLSGIGIDKVERAIKRRDSMAKAARSRSQSRSALLHFATVETIVGWPKPSAENLRAVFRSAAKSLVEQGLRLENVSDEWSTELNAFNARNTLEIWEVHLGQAGLHTSDLSEGRYAKRLSKAVMAALRQDWRRRVRPGACVPPLLRPGA